MNNFRRLIVTHIGLAAFSCQVIPSFAQVKGEASKEGMASRPYRVVDVPADKGSVLIFFDFSCQFCAKYHSSLMRWSKSVPSSIKVTPVPVVNSADHIKVAEQTIAARCYYLAASMIGGDRLDAFSNSVYESVGKGLSLRDSAIWTRACQAVQIDVKEFARRLVVENQENRIRYSAAMVLAYQLKATPSIGIGGKYVLTPDDVNGDSTMFFNILNGLTSKTILS